MKIVARETIGRNDPCPCGSGLKYKKCHIDKPFDWEESTGEQTASQELSSTFADRQVQALIVLGIIVAIGAGVWKGTYTGIVLGAGWALGLTVYLSFRNPPPINENAGDPAALNFGMSNDEKKSNRTEPRQNRAARRANRR